MRKLPLKLFSFLMMTVAFTVMTASQAHAGASDAALFDPPKLVTLQGYDGDAMEPFISRDGSTLFFNNLNESSQNTDIHYAAKIDPLNFRYQGRVGGVNTDALEGVPTMDSAGTFYFVSPRAYDTDRSTLFTGKFSNGAVAGARLLQGDVSRHQTFWFNMDLEISADGKTLYFTTNHKPLIGSMDVSTLGVAHWTASGEFMRDPNSDDIMRNVNLEGAFDYAAGISEDELTLYFTRVVPGADTPPAIYVATRQSKNSPFGVPQHIDAIQGFVEGPTVVPGGCAIYFHKKVDDVFHIFLAHKTNCN